MRRPCPIFGSPVFFGLLAATATLSVGCSSGPPTFGERLSSQGGEIRAIGERWQEGREMIETGRERVERGQRQIRDGNENIEEGRDLIAQGEDMVRESEAEYRRVERATIPSAAE